MNILEQLGSQGVIPVVIIENENAAEPLAEALVRGGLPCAEVTFRTQAARNTIVRMRKANSSMLIGAGTVLTVEQVNMAIGAGAQFIVSPGMNPKVVEYCLDRQIPITPGVATPTEIERAMEIGLEVVKFFPAEACGGLKYLKAIAAPYRTMRFIPTGGIDESNIGSYLGFPRVLACGGSWMVKPELIAGGCFDEIERLTRSALELVGRARSSNGVSAGKAPVAQ
jgi:2-dehydro-3-deoxyphosphogluconate aldolase / (4S)-4-hydroxy-2-oxoglutarate aldolase